MARSDLLRRLFASYAHGDDATFRAAAADLIADERRKRHDLLAIELERALEIDMRPGAAVPLTLRPVPKSRDDRPLLRLVKPARRFEDLVLGSRTVQVLRELVEENLERGALASHGLRPRQRMLFIGPSGTGKSASAHAIAAELSLPVAVASLPGLMSSFLGETSRNVEAVVRFAEQTPCVLVFDEFDTLAQERSERGDHGEVRRVVATVLQLLDDMHGESIAVATSNHPALLDAAIWRRFDDVVPFVLLDVDEVVRLLELKLRAVPRELTVSRWAESLGDATPAEVEIVCWDAMRRMVLRDAEALTDDLMGEAVDRMHSRQSVIASYLDRR
jgi:SpoVK/Ycf46/Vps4 family AAA+-type ATPase